MANSKQLKDEMDKAFKEGMADLAKAIFFGLAEAADLEVMMDDTRTESTDECPECS